MACILSPSSMLLLSACWLWDGGEGDWVLAGVYSWGIWVLAEVYGGEEDPGSWQGCIDGGLDPGRAIWLGGGA